MDVSFNEEEIQPNTVLGTQRQGIMGWLIAQKFAKDERAANQMLVASIFVLILIAGFFVAPLIRLPQGKAVTSPTYTPPDEPIR